MNKLTAEKCREHFEEWFAEYAGQTIGWVKAQRASDTHYKVGPEINGYWRAWQASRDSLPILEQQERGEGEWIEWGGGLVPPVTGLVEVRYRNGREHSGCKASDYSWALGLGGLTIIAYRIIPEQPTNHNGEQ